MAIYFHTEKISFHFRNRRIYKKWISDVVKRNGKVLGDISIIFTSNDHLLTINRDYLKHNYFTDVITFDYGLKDNLSGDIFISIDQVLLNCEDLKTVFEEELRRVIIHGVLHLCGFMDNTMEETEIIRREEDEALKIYNALV